MIKEPPDAAVPELPRTRVSIADLDRRPPPLEPESAVWMRQLDLTLLIGGFLLRTALYAGIYAVANHWDFGPAMLAGLLAGDLVGSVATLGWDWRARGAAAIVELLLVAAFATWWWSGCGYIPARPDFQAIAVLAGFAAFTVRTGAQATRHFGARDDLA